MQPAAIIQSTITFVKETLAGAEGGHDWLHIERVWKMAKLIQNQEDQGDLLVIELASLLHDISDAKFNGGDEEAGGQLAYHFLVRNGLDRERSEHIQTIIKYASYRGGFPQHRINSIEFQIVQDADRLDAMGAIGIARAFSYGGYRHRPFYDPAIPPKEYQSPQAYHASGAPTLNHFYEKLLKLKELMNTQTGKTIASERHGFMLLFLENFHRECGIRKENSD